MKDLKGWALGDVIVGAHMNSTENPRATGKARPMLIVGLEGGQALVVGLTSKSHYSSGEPRIPVPQPQDVGLKGDGYLWGGRVQRLSFLDIHRRIGRVHPELAQAVIDLHDLGQERAWQLMAIARGVSPSAFVVEADDDSEGGASWVG